MLRLATEQLQSIYKKIDGITGDILGAICELGELIFLIMIYLISQFVWVI